MRYVVIPIYDDSELPKVLDVVGTDVHILSDIDDLTGLVEACLPSTTSVDEQLVLAINKELAKATARACAERARVSWGSTHT